MSTPTLTNGTEVSSVEESFKRSPTLTSHGGESDLERSARTSTETKELKESLNISSKLIDWDGPDDPENPRNWTSSKKWTVTMIVSLFAFISPVASSISAPTLPQISSQFGLQDGSIIQNMSLSIFVLAYALGPLVWGPLSELFGRVVVIQVSNLMFLIFNLACSRATNTTQLLAFRFLAGFGSCAPMSIGGGVVGDLFTPDQRGMAMSVYSLAPLVGPSTGPLVGAWIAQLSNWRWVFYSTSIADGILQVAAFIFVRETYHPELLRRKARAARIATGDPTLRCIHDKGIHWTRVFSNGIIRPLKFLVVEPIVQVFALYMAVLYGILYLTLVSFVEVYTDVYRETPGIAGLHYLAIVFGSTVGGQVGSMVLNKLYGRMKVKNGGVATPEMRLPLLMVTAAFLPIGLVVFGWPAQHRIFWFLPDLGVFLFSIGIGGNWVCIQTYLVDNYALYAASAISACSSFRALAGFGFPLFSNQLYGNLGIGLGSTVLAIISLVIGCPSPFFFYKYGPQLRKWSKNTLVEA